MNLERTRQQLRDLERLLQQMLAVPSESAASNELPSNETTTDRAETVPIQAEQIAASDATVSESAEAIVSLRVYDPPPFSPSEVDEIPPAPAASPAAKIVAPPPSEQPVGEWESMTETSVTTLETPPPESLAAGSFSLEPMPPIVELFLHSATEPLDQDFVSAPRTVIISSEAPMLEESSTDRNHQMGASTRSFIGWTVLLAVVTAVAIAVARWLTFPHSW